MDRVTEVPDSVLSIPKHNRCGIVGLLSSWSSVPMSQFWVANLWFPKNGEWRDCLYACILTIASARYRPHWAAEMLIARNTDASGTGDPLTLGPNPISPTSSPKVHQCSTTPLRRSVQSSGSCTAGPILQYSPNLSCWEQSPGPISNFLESGGEGERTIGTYTRFPSTTSMKSSTVASAWWIETWH